MYLSMLERAMRKGMLHSYKINQPFSIKLRSEPKLTEFAAFVNHWIGRNLSFSVSQFFFFQKEGQCQLHEVAFSQGSLQLSQAMTNMEGRI